MLEAHKWRAGRGHDRLDFLVLDSFDAGNGERQERREMPSRSKKGIAMRISSKRNQVDGRHVVAAVMGTEKDGFALMPISTPSRQSLPPESLVSSLLFLRTTDLFPIQLQNVFPKSNSHKNLKWGEHCEFSRQERSAQLMTQRRQMARLASRPHTRLMGNHENLSSGLTENCRGVFICSDGLTTLPYEILGEASLAASSHNFVVVHDIFDTLDSTKIFFQRLLHRHPACQILIYNYSGQAGTTFLTGNSVRTGLHASHLAELLQHVNLRGKMLLSSGPFYLVGIGYGFSICTQFVISHYCEQDPRSSVYQMLKGLVSVNGTAQIDRQYAAILHALLDSCDRFPKERFDLPVSYLSRFQFSDRYLARVHPQLALNIYTAVANPITLQGRAALARGALQNYLDIDLLSRVSLPIFALQSTENLLVTPSNVEVIVRGRITNHVWSHEVRVGALGEGAYFGARTRATIRGMVERIKDNSAGSACVVWVRAGHEIRQEAPNVMLDFFDIIAPSTTAISAGLTRSVFEPTPHSEIEPAGVDAIAADVRLAPPPQTNLTGERQKTHFSSANVLRSEPLMTLKCEPRLYDSKKAAKGAGREEGKTDQDMSHHADLFEEPPLSFGLTFGVSFPNVAMHEFTRRRRYSFFKIVSTSLADAVVHIQVEDIVMRAIYAGSLVVSAHITAGAPSSMDAATFADTITDALNRALTSSNCATAWGRPTFLSISRRQENKGGLKHQLPQDSTSSVQSQLSTETQRQAGLYVDQTDNASTSIEDDEGSRTRTRQLIEMQRNVNVDRAEIRLVTAQVVPVYKTQPGVQQPVLHPPPVAYRESFMPSSIAHRHDPETLFSDANIHLSPEPRGQETLASKEDDITREMASAQLLREWDIAQPRRRRGVRGV